LALEEALKSKEPPSREAVEAILFPKRERRDRRNRDNEEEKTEDQPDRRRGRGNRGRQKKQSKKTFNYNEEAFPSMG